jgi:hypothetical protein
MKHLMILLLAIPLILVCPTAPARAQWGAVPAEPRWGANDDGHVWRDASWWGNNRPDSIRLHHPDWWGDFDDARSWHPAWWWWQNRADWARTHHPEWWGDYAQDPDDPASKYGIPRGGGGCSGDSGRWITIRNGGAISTRAGGIRPDGGGRTNLIGSARTIPSGGAITTTIITGGLLDGGAAQSRLGEAISSALVGRLR